MQQQQWWWQQQHCTEQQLWWQAFALWCGCSRVKDRYNSLMDHTATLFEDAASEAFEPKQVFGTRRLCMDSGLQGASDSIESVLFLLLLQVKLCLPVVHPVWSCRSQDAFCKQAREEGGGACAHRIRKGAQLLQIMC
jgi:hypothetical protein